MNSFKELLGRYCEYKDVTCRINSVPQPPLSDYFSLMPVKVIGDIGNGKGKSKTLTPLEFEVDVKLHTQFYKFYEK